MSKFKLITLFFLCLFALFFLLKDEVGLSYSILLILFFIYTSLVAYGCYEIQFSFFLKSKNKIKTTKNIVALTFDDAPSTPHTEKILTILKAENVLATFFCIGKKIENEPKVISKIIEAGHLVGNHSYSHHYSLDFKSTKNVKEDIQKTNELLTKYTGAAIRFFRPPFGVTNPNIAQAVAELQMISIGWSIRTLDTVLKNKEALFEKAAKDLQPGAIILLHDFPQITQENLAELIKFIRSKNYEIVRLDELLANEE